MNREFIQRHLSTTSIFLFAILLMAAVACAGGSDDGATTADDGGESAGAASGDTGAPAPPAGEGDEPAAIDCVGNNVKIVNVTVGEKGNSGKWDVSVDKNSVEIHTEQRVCWEISGLETDYTLIMQGKTEEDRQINRGQASPPKTFINSGPPKATGTFNYDLILNDPAGTEVGKLDPEVIIRPCC